MPESVTCLHLFADAAGESRIEEISYEIAMVDYAPPAPALGLSAPTAATRAYWLHFPASWHDAAHPSPRRQLFLMLEGEVELATSTGETRVLRPGDRLLMEDTRGKGHGARPLGGPALGLMIALE